MFEALRKHWVKYVIEAAALGCFMISACIIVVLMEYPGSPVHAMFPNGTIRLYIIGVEMGFTAYFLVASPWGKISGPHMNPAFTLSFLLLGKMETWDAILYMLFQFVGGYLGVQISAAILPGVGHPSVNYVVTAPGQSGILVAFIAEFAMSFALMGLVLIFSHSARLQRWTPHLVGVLIGGYIAFEAPFSGMSVNPARSVASAASANQWSAIWIYFLAPILGMVLASQGFERFHVRRAADREVNLAATS